MLDNKLLLVHSTLPLPHWEYLKLQSLLEIWDLEWEVEWDPVWDPVSVVEWTEVWDLEIWDPVWEVEWDLIWDLEIWDMDQDLEWVVEPVTLLLDHPFDDN